MSAESTEEFSDESTDRAQGRTPGPARDAADEAAPDTGSEDLYEMLSYMDATPDLEEPAQPGAASDGASAVGENGAEELQIELDLDELAARAGRADEYLELAQRTRADFENYRKRAAREVAAAQERGIAKLARELLPAIDNLDRALQAALGAAPTAEPGDQPEPAPDSQLISGIRLVQADVLAALARVGIEPFSPIGEPFDPQFHEAVAQAPSAGAEPGTVAEVYQPGYRMGD
jgi:molecular chaperone GrpE